MTGVTPDHLHRFVERAAARLRGDWVLLDGAVLPLLGLEIRVTLDIDVAGPDGATQADVVTLLEIAVECGLPPEAVNTAGAFFLRALPGWRDDLVVVRRGEHGRILRPGTTLFVRTKLDRLSTADLADCLALLRHATGQGAPPDRDRLRAEIDARLAERPHAERAGRLATLRAALG